MFVDTAQIKLKAGDGGDGAVSFRHEKFVDKGGPDGGDGGDGGSIIMSASRNQDTLAAFRYQKLQQGEPGRPGTESKKHGRRGKNLYIDAPVGTVIIDSQGQELADLAIDGQQVVVAKGGKGGFGNAHFISSTRQAPRVAEKGEAGQELEVTLELKMIADVGLVGLPNAGKSTLLSVISSAKPEIGNYPFTTIRPNLGVADVGGEKSLLVADIPGLIEGASEGKGLGDEFLRHVERSGVLVHLVDIYSNDLTGDYKTIIKELADYKIDLSKRPQVVVLTKIEGLDDEMINSRLAELQPLVAAKTPLMAISAQSGKGVKELLFELQSLVEKSHKKIAKKQLASNQLPVIGFTPTENDWQVSKSGKNYLVKGRKIERFAARTRFGEYHAEQRLRDIMKKMYILKELERQGIEPGQKIIIGQPEFGRIEY